jgi:hypothetical protein
VNGSGRGGIAGAAMIRTNLVGTVVFVLSSTWAAVVFDGVAKTQGVVIDLLLFAIGVVAFLWGYFAAVQRSRSDQMSVAELYFLMGTAIPSRVRRTMNALLAVQVVVALVTALSRLTTPGESGPTNGSTLAFGVLVPMLGLGLNGLWAANHGDFPPRRLKDGKGRPADDSEIG